MYHILKYVLILFSINQSVYCFYRYAGCFTQVFHESYFMSSFMEPTLCFRLCDTQIIYIQKTICRCSGGGLMHHNRQIDKLCSIPCTKPVDRSVNSTNTCGGLFTYSAYVQEKFYSLHGHLFRYQIQFLACELWKNSDVYDTSSVTLSDIPVHSSLNKLEKCAAACLDQNITTKSIAFNDDSDKCLCMMPLRPTKYFERTHYTSILPNSSCDRYCINTFEGSKTEVKYQCGSLNDTHIWAIYDLDGTCPMNFAYIEGINKCVYTYKNFWNSCTSPAVSFVYDGSFTWSNYLKMIDTLKLNDTIVTVDFDTSVVVDQTWKCASSLSTSISSSSDTWRSYFSQSRSTLVGWGSNTRYILENGCLRESSYSSYSHRYSYRLCVTDPVNKYSAEDDDSNGTYITAINPFRKYCPTNWFDLNGRCYRMSDERKTIEQARNSCISVSSTQLESEISDRPSIWVIDSNGKVISEDELNDSPTGQIVEYVSEWQSRLGFFLLDTDPDADNDETDTTTTIPSVFYDNALISLTNNETIDLDHGAINEFQVIEAIENQNSSIKNNACVVLTRSISEEEEKPIIRDSRTNNCSKPRHVLCETNTLIVQNFQYNCFTKPRALDLPALISKYLTHELCLSVCQELQTKLAILHVNKCYCLNGVNSNSLNISTDFQKFRQATCGDPCPGNSHERCGDENTIVVFQILDSRRTFTYSRTPPEPFPNYIYDSCVRLNSFNQSITYQFTLNHIHDFHPRYCLALCTKYEQKYSLINNGKCLCTNQPMKGEEDDTEILTGQFCSRPCPGNYFYTCGNSNSSTIYSMYIWQPKCRHGFEVAENDQQCVYSHFSAKTNSLIAAQNYCQSIGSTLAKINEIIEIQDILPDSILHTRLMQQLLVFYKFRFVNDTRLYWIDRTTDIPSPKTISERLLNQCSNTSKSIDKNCIAIQYVPASDQSKASHERCIIESNECSIQTAMPVCVDQHLEPKLTFVPPITDDISAQISTNITIDHSCGDDTNDYHFVDDYCYKILPHETSWNDAKLACQRDNATLFIPEKSVSLQYIKSLYLRLRTYTSSDFAHVGVYYDVSNRTVIQHNSSDENNPLIVPDSNAIYDLCEKTFQDRYTALMLSTSSPTILKNRLKQEQIGCGYIDLISSIVPSIRCDEIPCNRTATVICQKLPTIQTSIVKAKREYNQSPTTRDVTKSPSTSAISVDQTSTAVISSDSQSDTEDVKSVGRDFAPMFFILAIAFAFILLGFISALYHRRSTIFRRPSRRNTNSVYSPLTSENEFPLD